MHLHSLIKVDSAVYTAPDKSKFYKNISLFSPHKHMLWVVIRSSEALLMSTKTYVVGTH